MFLNTLRSRCLSEFIAILAIVAIAIVSTIIFYNFAGTMLSRMHPEIEYLEASVVGVEVVHAGTELAIDIDGTSYKAYYVYKVTVTLHNVGSQSIQDLSYTTIDIDDSLDTCTSDTCEIYDPVVFTKRYTNLPSQLEPNQAVQVSFTVLSKVDLLKLGYSPFIIKVEGSLPDGNKCKIYIGLFGEST